MIYWSFNNENRKVIKDIENLKMLQLFFGVAVTNNIILEKIFKVDVD